MTREKDNACRLAGALYRHADKQFVKVLAEYLNYIPEQLEKDIDDLYNVVRESRNVK